MALFRQLRLLLWKNGLVAIRQPVIGVIDVFKHLHYRNHFVVSSPGYVSPRNLPSAGFFPFLQTLMCNTDSSCNNESYLVDPAAQKTRSTQQRSSPLGSLVKGAPSFDSDFLKDINPGTLLAALKDIYGMLYPFTHPAFFSCHLQEFLNQSQGSVNVLKRAACTMILPMINTTSSSTLNYAVAAYCQSNNTVLEVSLRTLNQILTELMVTKPDEMLKKAGVMMEAFDQLQNHPALWESLLAAPRALSSGSPDQVLGSTNDLLTHLQGALHVTKGNFSDTDAALSSLHPVLVGGINMINYIQNWPGKNVSVSLGDIIALQNDSISEVVKHVLPEVQIPLHQAIVLAWDKDMARSYVCNNGSNSVFVTAACSTGTMDILLSWISPYKVATQALLAWSKDVAPQDVAFVKGLLHSMTEGSYPGGQGASTSRARRSIDTQPQNIEEELQFIFPQAQEIYSNLTDQATYNVTLHMVLSEWQELKSHSLRFQALLERLTTGLGQVYWMNWTPDSGIHNATGTLLESVFLFMVNFGEKLEESQLWPKVKDYFHTIFWILSYRPNVSIHPANCSFDNHTMALHCDTGLNWPQFVQAVAQALMSPSKALVKNTSNPHVMLPLLGYLLQPTGLTPLLPLFFSDDPINASTVIDIASNLGRSNQHIFIFNDTDPSVPELEQLLMQFFSLDGNLTLSISHIIGYSLLSYYNYFNLEDVAHLRESIQPFKNQTSAGLVGILRAMELLKTVIDSQNGDPVNVTLLYIRQLQELVMSLCKFQKIKQHLLPSGQMSVAQVIGPQMLSKDFFNFLTPENLQNLTRAGPDAAQNILIQTFVAFLPAGIQQKAARFLQHFQALQYQISKCAEGQNCSDDISNIFTFLDQILDMMRSADGNASINITGINTVLGGWENEEITSTFFSLLLSPDDAAEVETFKKIFYFIRLITATQNISLSDIQTTLGKLNLTLDELNNIAALAGTDNINDLMDNIMEIINARKCFEPQNDLMMTTQCVMGFINGISRFLTHLPDFSNETDFLSLIPLILNETFSDVVQVNVSSNPNMFIVHLLNSTLANIKMSLQLNQMNTSEIMNEIKVLEDLMQLLDNTDPFTNSLNTTLMENPIYAQKVSIEIVEWYLKRLENITSNTSVSELLRPFFYLTQMQLTFQLAQTDFSLYVSNQIQFLIDSIPHPIDGEGVIKIGYTVVEILQHLFNITKDNPVLEPLFKTIILNTSNHHTELYLDLIEKWMEQPNVTLILTNILQWGNSSMNVSNQMTDIQQLQQTVANFLSDDQLAYLAMIGNITRSLSKVLMVAEQPGGLQSDHFLAAILEVEKSAMQLLTNATGHMPLSVQQDILEIVQYSLKLLLQPDVSFASSHNISLLILKRAENIIQQTIPGMFADYLLYGLKVATTYFEGIATAGGPEHWNDLVLNEMKTVQSILPPNSTVQAYISLLINITHFILETGQGNRSLWEGFEGVSVQNATIITEQMGKLLSILWPLGMGGPNSNSTAQSLEGFSSFVPILEQIITCQADNDTWDKLEKVLEALLSTLEETELLDNASSGMPLFEKSIGRLVNIIQAQNGEMMMASLQKPLVILMREIVQSVNTSHYNFSQVLPGMQHAIDSTIQAAQCNGTLKCSEALNIWDPVIEAAGLSYNTMAMWCNISLQPALEASVAAQTAFSNLSMSVSRSIATAARIVKTVQSLYQVWVNETLVTEQLIMAFSNEFSELFGHRLSPEVQLYWQRKPLSYVVLNRIHIRCRISCDFFVIEMQQTSQFCAGLEEASVSSMRMLSGELRSKIPSLQPYTDAGEKALDYILNNYNLIKNGSSSEDFFRKAAMIFLTSVNISPDIFSEMWGNWSGVSESSYIEMMRGIIKLMGDLHILRDAPTVYQAMEKFLESNDTSLIMQKVVEMSSWWNSTEASRLDLVTQALPKICDTIMPLLPLLNQMGMDIPANMKLCDDLAGNMAVMLRQLVNTSGLLPPMAYEPTGGNHMVWFQQRHKGPWMPMRSPMDDFIDLFYIDYSDMFKAISVPPTTEEIMETAHMFFDNPDLSVVLKGATGDMQWGFNDLQEDTIDAGLGMLAFLTLPITFQMSPMDILTNATDILPDDYSFSSLLKNITIAMATESQGNFTVQTYHLSDSVCALENTESAHLLMSLFSIEPGQLCNTFLPSLQFLIENRLMNMTSLSDAIFDAFIGDPITYTVQATCSVLAQSLKFNTSSLKDLNVNMTSPGTVMVGEMLRNQTAFVLDVQQYMDFNLSVLHLLMETPLPNSNKEILSWLANLHQCSSASMNMKCSDVVIFNTFCSMSTEQWYTFSLLVARHLNLEKFTFRLLLCEELQSMMGVMLQLVQVLTDAMDKLLPSIGQLQKFLLSIEDLSLGASNEFKHKTRHRRSVTSSEATFVTLSRALCSNGITALFAISEIPSRSDSSPSSPNNQEREEIIERFKIPRNATPYCTNMFLEMVSTTGGAIAWAFLKPMLMGQILYTPDTDVTRAIMEKSNDTLHEFANLAQNSGDWIKTSGQIVKSAEILSHTLPMLNAFVKNFIELHTDINVDRMKETIGNFSDMTMMLNQNKRVLDQISTLSNVLVNISSCIKFDRYRGYDSADQLDAAAQELAKNRELYAGVIFKLPKEDSSWNLSSSTSPLPPIVSYTIRMHMDNVIRTDRTRDSYFMKHPHMLARKTMRYNRGFVYLQENLDRAIIEIQTRQKVTEPAVQLQAFPYPCHLRDEYLDGISFNFPTMMMMAWVLFVADFVKKKVHERELRLHEYMKMMGVNPLSHFFAWFLESAAYLLMTIIILTLVLKHGRILPNSDGFILFLYFCDYGFSILAFSYLVSSFFDQTYIAGLSGSLLYILCFFPFLVVMSVEGSLNIFQKSALSLFSPTCFSYAGQYVFRYENQGEGIQWSNSYTSPLAGDTASFGWMCWLMLIDSILYFLIGVYIRMVFPGKYGIPAPWYFPFKASFWADLCCSSKPRRQVVASVFVFFFSDECTLSCQSGENFSTLPVGVTLHGLTKIYGDRAAIQNLNVSFYEGHVTSLLGHNGAGKTTTMSLLTGLFAPSSGTIEVYGRDMQSNIDDVRKELGVCMQYDVLFDHMTAKEHLLLYGQIKAPHWSPGQLREQIRKTLEETGMYAHRHKLVGALSGGMKRKLSISIAFIGGSRLVVLDEPTTGVDPCSRRSIWDIIIQNKKQHTIIMSTHHLDEAEVLSDRIAFLEKGGLKCCGSPFYLKEKLGQGYKLTLNKKQSGNIDDAELKAFVQAHVPGAQLKEVHRGDLIYSLPPLTSSNTSSYRSLLAALDSNLDSLQLEGYGISDTTLEEVFLQLTHENTEAGADDGLLSVSETLSDTGSLDSFPSDDSEGISKLTSSTVLCGMALTWQQISAILIKRFHHSRRDWKGLLSQILLPVLFVIFAMSLGSIKNNLKNYPEMELSPALYNIGPSYSFFRNQNPNSSHLVDAMMSFPGIDNACLNKPDKTVCRISANSWSSSGNSSKGFSVCKCTPQEQICEANNFQPPHTQFPSSQIVYDLSGIDTENYLVATANDFIRNRYGGFDFGMPLPSDLQKDLKAVPKNRTLSKVWFNPEGFHTMPAYLNSLNNFILRSNLPADKDPRDYAIFVSSHPYFGRMDDEDIILQGMLHILVALCVMLGYSIMTASFAIYEVNEHHGGSKALQHIAGISEPLYWTVNFFYDMVMYMIPVTLTVAVVAAFQIPAFTDRQNLAAVTLLMVLFGFATFPWMYLLSSVFKDAEMAFIIYVCINLFISINTITSTSILYFLSQISHTNLEAIKDTLNTLNCAFKIFPQFNFGNGLIELARKDIDVQILSGYGIDAYQNPFSTESLGWMFMSSFIQGLVFFTLRLLFNRSLIRKVRRLICGRKTVSQEPCEDEDEDVVAEHLRVSSGGASSDILQVNQLTKVYQYLKTKVHAVKRLSVGIPAGECFGLLGVNGAGKTTTFKMLTGDVSPTDGTAQIRDWDGRLVDIMECRNKGINIGYCPQVDALDSLLTGREHLYFYARIRGISKREIDRLVNYLLKRLELSDYSNIITDGYSCGTRRKLSTALALIGHPQILLLDEPSSGMDPRTKRHLWKIISEEVKGKSAVVLTSHSMEECEALCSRLAIMVKGQFRCLGSLQHIKNRFGNGFTVKMYMANASCDAQAITNFMQHHFPSTYLKDQHSTMVDYHVPIAPGGVADIFDKLESNRNTLQIKHFSVSQTTLDEVFINFAMGKVGMETIPQGEDEHELGSIKAIQTKS
uniref:ABC transporter domain-containing protein n=1 Tax=Monopterus albus TaxID=43700 RepID=A0A3Q3JQ42_MONAL